MKGEKLSIKFVTQVGSCDHLFENSALKFFFDDDFFDFCAKFWVVVLDKLHIVIEGLDIVLIHEGDKQVLQENFTYQGKNHEQNDPDFEFYLQKVNNSRDIFTSQWRYSDCVNGVQKLGEVEASERSHVLVVPELLYSRKKNESGSSEGENE